jgi:hypothetical protein
VGRLAAVACQEQSRSEYRLSANSINSRPLRSPQDWWEVEAVGAKGVEAERPTLLVSALVFRSRRLPLIRERARQPEPSSAQEEAELQEAEGPLSLAVQKREDAKRAE